MRKSLLAFALLAAAPVSAWDRLDGQNSGVRAFHTEAVKDEAAWRSLWARHAPDSLLPAVDFGREQVAAVFLGQTRTAGVTVAVELMADPLDAARLVVFYRAVRPAPAGFTASVITYPFVFVKTRRASEVVFESDGAMGVPEREPRPTVPFDGRRARALLESLGLPSFDGR